jgi:hypothetical protein
MARCLREYTLGVWSDALPHPDTGIPPGNYDVATLPFNGDLFTVDVLDGGAINPIFDLQRSPRWGYAPTGSFGPGASVPFVITDFTPVFIQSLAGKCNAGGCNWTWNAGETQVGTLGGSKVTSAIAFSIPKAALPQIVNDNAPGVLDTLDYILFR